MLVGLAAALLLPLGLKFRFKVNAGRLEAAFGVCLGSCLQVMQFDTAGPQPVAEAAGEVRQAAGRAGGPRQAWRFIPWRGLGRYGRWLLKGFACRDLSVRCELGAGDPAATAYAYGAVWALLAALHQVMARFLGAGPGRPDLRVVPFFSGQRLALEARCIVVARLGHIISAGLLLAALVAGEVWRHKRSRWRDERPPHRIPDAHGHGEHQGHGGREYGSR